jgi:hypothetical protein
MRATKPPILYIDQFGNRIWARTVNELRSQIGRGTSRVSKMYADKLDGRTVHTGYVIGKHWLAAYAPVEKAAVRHTCQFQHETKEF